MDMSLGFQDVQQDTPDTQQDTPPQNNTPPAETSMTPGQQGAVAVTQSNATPYSVLDQEQKELWGHYKQLFDNLKQQPINGRNRQQIFAMHQRYQAELNQKAQPILGKRKQLDTINTLVSQGQIDPQSGTKAMWKAVLPGDVAAAMFPTVRKDSQFSMSQMKQIIGPEGGVDKQGNDSGIIKVYSRPENVQLDSKDASVFKSGYPFIDYIQPFQLDATDVRKQPRLVEQYSAAKDEVEAKLGIPMTNIQAEQFDNAWDFEMKQHPKYEWDPQSGEIQALRARGTLAQAGGKNITPFGRHIINYNTQSPASPEQQTQSQTLNPNDPGHQKIASDIMAEAGYDRNKARALAAQRGYKF
jgi:hypothetical protein